MSLETKIVINAAAIGGTAEALGGGKFANGAVTGAYVMMFNHVHDKIQEERIEKQLRNTIPKETLAAMTPEQRKTFFQLYRKMQRQGYEYINHKTFIQGQQNLSDLWGTGAFGIAVYSVFALKYTMGLSVIGLLSGYGASWISSSYDSIVYSYNNLDNNPQLGVFVLNKLTQTSWETKYYNAASGDFLGKIILPRNLQR